jgi:hypothetical protein
VFERNKAGEPWLVRIWARLGGVTMTVALLVAGCSSGDREQEVSQRAESFLKAAAGGDTGTACSLLAPKTLEDLSTSEGSSCPEALPADRLRAGTVQSVQVWSDRAKVDTDGGSVFLAEFDNGWRVAAAGCTSRGESLPYRCVVGD